MARTKGNSSIGHGFYDSTQRGNERLAKLFETIDEIKLWAKKKVYKSHGWVFGRDVLNLNVIFMHISYG